MGRRIHATIHGPPPLREQTMNRLCRKIRAANKAETAAASSAKVGARRGAQSNSCCAPVRRQRAVPM
jgi:hypothetical protein